MSRCLVQHHRNKFWEPRVWEPEVVRAYERRSHIAKTDVLERRLANTRHTSIGFWGVQRKTGFTVHTVIVTTEIVDGDIHAGSI